MSCSFIAWVYKHGQVSTTSVDDPDSSAFSQYYSSMLFWTEYIYRERGVEPPRRERLEWALTQAVKLLESPRQEYDEQKHEDDLDDCDTSDTLSDSGAKPKVKRTRAQRSQADYKCKEPPALTFTQFSTALRVVDPSIIPGAVVTNCESTPAYSSAHAVPEAQRVTYLDLNRPALKRNRAGELEAELERVEEEEAEDDDEFEGFDD